MPVPDALRLLVGRTVREVTTESYSGGLEAARVLCADGVVVEFRAVDENEWVELDVREIGGPLVESE